MKKKLSDNNNNAKARSNGYSGDKLLRTSEVLQLLKISRTTLRKLIFLGTLSPVMLGSKAQRFSAREVSDFIEDRKSERETGMHINNDVGFSPNDLEVLNSLCAEVPG